MQEIEIENWSVVAKGWKEGTGELGGGVEWNGSI